MAYIEFAPDGKHFIKGRSGKLAKMWEFFTTSPDIRIQLALYPQAKFRLIGDSGKIIGIHKRAMKKARKVI
jgi:hypothetical protein